MRLYLLLPLLALLLLSCSQAKSGHITLLTVSEGENGAGGTADLYLEVRPGNGAVFIDSFPLTRIDTQGSTRYANQIACDTLQIDCSQYDFFYTIRANTAIVGGPSASAAMAVLTVAVLDGEKIDQHMALTGTINSGGIIGPVAGISRKVQAAKRVGITTVLIPALVTDYGLGENFTEDNQSLALDLSTVRGRVDELSDDELTVIKVGTLEEALFAFTGKNYSRSLPPLVPPPEYNALMGQIATDICERTTTLKALVERKNLSYNDTNNYSARLAQLPQDHAYSRASLCFSSNIELNTLLLSNSSQAMVRARARQVYDEAKLLDAKTRNTSITTITDLETYAIVMERVLETEDILEAINTSAVNPAQVAYAQERLSSAQSWQRFFEMPGREVQLDPVYLQRACLSKISEADERINYIRFYSDSLAAEAEKTLEDAYAYDRQEPILCIFTASKAKAQANLLASALAIREEHADDLLREKRQADLIVLQKQQEKGFFPVLGYSYTQYAGDLETSATYSALTFAEYALELSNLDLYFPQKSYLHIPAGVREGMLLFFYGTIMGVGITAFVLRRKPKRKKKP